MFRALKSMLLGFVLALPVEVFAQDYSWSSCLQLKASDHTQIIGFIIKHADGLVPLAKSIDMDLNDREAFFNPASASTFLLAVRDKFNASDSLGKALALAAYCITSAEGYAQPTPTGTTVFDIRAILSGANEVGRLITKFQNLQGNTDPESQEYQAIDVSLAILIDGKNSIYREDDPLALYQELAEESAKLEDESQRKTAGEFALEIAKEDVKGALSGALGGCAAGLLAGGAGCAPGALAGGISTAVGTSALTVLESVWKSSVK